MKCNYCKKDIERGKEVKVNRALFTIDRATRQSFFSAAFYHKECWQVIHQKRKREIKWFWILAIIMFFLSVLVFGWLFYKKYS